MNRNRLFLGGLLFLVLLLGYILFLLKSIVVPLLLALILAYFLDPAVRRLERWGLPRGVAVGAVFAAFVLAAGSGLAFLVPATQRELAEIQEDLPRYAENLFRLAPEPLLEGLGITRGEDLQSLFDRVLAGMRQLSFEVVRQVAVFLSKAFTSTLGFILAVLGYFIIPVYLYYLLVDFDRMREGVMALVPLRWREEATALGRDINEVILVQAPSINTGPSGIL